MAFAQAIHSPKTGTETSKQTLLNVTCERNKQQRSGGLNRGSTRSPNALVCHPLSCARGRAYGGASGGTAHPRRSWNSRVLQLP